MRAIAKTNLYLRVTGRREDGYHDLENVFMPLRELYDEVELIPAASNGGRFVAEGLSVPVDGDNLCLKALGAFEHASGCVFDGAVRLVKRIPVAAGMGGGSSDAAAVLLLLNEQFGNPLDGKALHGIAAGLGADVPFFLNPVPSLGTGRGDVLSPIDVNVHGELVMVSPGFPCPVAWAFQHLKPAESSVASLSEFLSAAAGTRLSAMAAACRNDLEAGVFGKFPLLVMMKDALRCGGALRVCLSGSGASLFALAEAGQGKAVVDSFKSAFPEFPQPVLCSF